MDNIDQVWGGSETGSLPSEERGQSASLASNPPPRSLAPDFLGCCNNCGCVRPSFVPNASISRKYTTFALLCVFIGMVAWVVMETTLITTFTLCASLWKWRKDAGGNHYGAGFRTPRFCQIVI